MKCVSASFTTPGRWPPLFSSGVSLPAAKAERLHRGSHTPASQESELSSTYAELIYGIGGYLWNSNHEVLPRTCLFLTHFLRIFFSPEDTSCVQISFSGMWSKTMASLPPSQTGVGSHFLHGIWKSSICKEKRMKPETAFPEDPCLYFWPFVSPQNFWTIFL